MSLASPIREDILKTLDDKILHVLTSQRVLQLLAAPPFYLSAGKQQILREEPLSDPPYNPLQEVHRWNEEQMLASRGIYLTFVYSGFIHKKVGVLESHRQQMKRRKQAAPAGVQLVRLKAPASILYADFTARENGSFFDEKAPRDTKILTLNFDHEITVTLSGYTHDEHICSHRLQMRDEALQQLAGIYKEEMRFEANTEASQTLLLAIMNRLRYRLAAMQVAPGNRREDESGQEGKLSKTQHKHRQLCQSAIEYVQNNIQQPLNIKQIARHLEVSEYHLSRIFHHAYGVTLIHYISVMRIDMAKTMLQSTNEPIREVALRTGFSSAESFSHVFRKHIGMSPKQFRNQYKTQRQ